MRIIKFINQILSENHSKYYWMKEYKSLKSFLQNTNTVKVWGASNGGKFVYREMQLQGIHVDCFIDSDVRKHNLFLDSIPVCGPHVINKDDVIVIASMYQSNIYNDSLKHKPVFVIPYDDFLNNITLWNLEYIHANSDKIQELYSLFDDHKSKEVLFSSIRFALTRDLSKIFTSTYNQYSHPIVRATKNDVIIDGGAYNGDSAKKFISDAENHCFVHCFEPLMENVKSIIKSAKINGFQSFLATHQIALGSSNKDIGFNIDPYSLQNNQVSIEGGNISVKQVTIDEFCAKNDVQPTLIKMDLEGYESNALEGALATIEQYRPKLQIAIYHNPEDFWHIPLKLSRHFPNYKFFLGHHGLGGFWDTVLYASPYY